MKTNLIRVSVVLVLLFGLSNAWAQTKVVVIPLGGDDANDPEPFAPLTANSPANGDYTIGGTNVVVDNVTELEWQREDDNTLRNWDDAVTYCVNLGLDSKTDWRLPDIDELQSIVDYGQSAPAINSVVFPNTNSSAYWSASPFSTDLGSAWVVNFDSGSVANALKFNLFHVRCVR